MTYVILTIARALVLGSSSRTDLPLLPFGSVSNRLLHLTRRPVLIVAQAGRARPGTDGTRCIGRGGRLRKTHLERDSFRQPQHGPKVPCIGCTALLRHPRATKLKGKW